MRGNNLANKASKNQRYYPRAAGTMIRLCSRTLGYANMRSSPSMSAPSLLRRNSV